MRSDPRAYPEAGFGGEIEVGSLCTVSPGHVEVTEGGATDVILLVKVNPWCVREK